MLGVLLLSSAIRAHAQQPGSADDTVFLGKRPWARQDADPAGLIGLRARITAVDSLGGRYRLEGVVAYADSTLVKLPCSTSEDGAAASPVQAFAPPCMDGVRTVMVSRMQQMRIRRAERASPAQTLRNGTNAMIGGAVFGAGVGAIGAVLFDLLITGSEDEKGVSRPAIYWPHVRTGALAVGAVGAATGGVVGIVWSRGVWVSVPLHWRDER